MSPTRPCGPPYLDNASRIDDSRAQHHGVHNKEGVLAADGAQHLELDRAHHEVVRQEVDGEGLEALTVRALESLPPVAHGRDGGIAAVMWFFLLTT